jgi:ectoine hydroxylase-related dioxygenase (phytanoyl-CoA dioxygenase family)
MKTNATAEQVEFYQRNGFVAIEGFLDSDELKVWQNATDEAVRQRIESFQPEKKGNVELSNVALGEDYYAKVFIQALRLADSSPDMRRLIYDPAIGKLAATLAGIDGIRVWHDQALYKHPFGNPTSYHLDNPYWSFSSHDSLSIWIALDDATLGNGCMWYLPGTHKTARFENVGIGPNLDGIFKVYPEWRKIEPVSVPAKAGTAVFHNGLTCHGAGANMTNRPRRAMTCGYMPEGSTFNGVRSILSDALFKSLKVGDVLNDPEQNPLVWAKDGRHEREKANAK